MRVRYKTKKTNDDENPFGLTEYVFFEEDKFKFVAIGNDVVCLGFTEKYRNQELESITIPTRFSQSEQMVLTRIASHAFAFKTMTEVHINSET